MEGISVLPFLRKRMAHIHSVLLVTSNRVFSHTKSASATSQLVILFFHSKSAPTTNHNQPNKANYHRYCITLLALQPYRMIAPAPARCKLTSQLSAMAGADHQPTSFPLF